MLEGHQIPSKPIQEQSCDVTDHRLCVRSVEDDALMFKLGFLVEHHYAMHYRRLVQSLQGLQCLLWFFQ